MKRLENLTKYVWSSATKVVSLTANCTLYGNLIAKSPYLSEEVLAELAEKENFPKTLIRDIMVANKHAGKDTDVMTKLENRNDELPEYMLLQIKNAAESGLSGKELLENNINTQTENYQKAINLQVNALNTDTTATIADYMTLYHTFLSIKTRNGSTDSLTTAEINTLTNIAGNANPAQVKARIILEMNVGERIYTEPLPVWIATPVMRKAKKVEKVKNITPFATVYPNPAKEYINFEFVNPLQEKAILTISDTEGKLIHTYTITENKNSYTLPVNTWTNGLYFYQINTNNALIEKGKFEVIK